MRSDFSLKYSSIADIFHGHVSILLRKLLFQFAQEIRHSFRFIRYGIYDRRYFQHAHFIPIVGVGKRGTY